MDITNATDPTAYAQWGVIGAFVFSNLATLGILIWLLLNVYKIQEESRNRDRIVIDNNTKALSELKTEIRLLGKNANG